MRTADRTTALFLLAAVLLPATAPAQESNESRLRDAVRQAVTEMRAAQDQAAQAQADLAKAQADKQALQTQLDAANAKLAAEDGKPKAPAADLVALQGQLRAGQAQNAALQQMNAKLQSNYQTAAEQARNRADEARQIQARQQADAATLKLCTSTNARLIDAAEQILHLYESQSFRSILLRSYEPVVGSAKVRLENMIQDYDDKIHAQEFAEKPVRPK